MSLQDVDDLDIGPSKRGKGRPMLGFKRMLAILLFFVGLIVGMYLEHTFVEPVINEEIRSEFAECDSERQLQSQQIDSLLECLEGAGVSPKECR